jgi:hypothetical protein
VQAENSIKWHFCDPKVAARAHAAAGNSARRTNTEGAAKKKVTTNSSGDKQITTVLNLLNRGKRQRQHAAADNETPARPMHIGAVRRRARCPTYLCATSSPCK